MSNSKNGEGTQDSVSAAGDAPQLIGAYREARKKARTASHVIGVLILLILTVNAMFAFYSTRGFLNERIPEVWVAFSKQLGPIMEKHWPRVRVIAKNAGPVYVDTFHKAADKEMPIMEELMQKELRKLAQHSLSKKDRIEGHFDKLARDWEKELVNKMEEGLGRPLTPEELNRITAIYQRVFRKKADEIFLRTYLEHNKAIDKMRLSLGRLVKTEPDLDRKVSEQEAIGILFEFIGVEMQYESQKNS